MTRIWSNQNPNSALQNQTVTGKNSNNKKSKYIIIYGKPSDQLFPKRWPLSNPDQTKDTINKYKVKRHKNYDINNRQQRATTELTPWKVSN